MDRVNRLLAAAVSFQVAAGLYIIFLDRPILEIAALHWVGIVAYSAVNVMLAIVYMRTGSPKAVELIGYWSAMGVAFMLLDAVLGIPFTAATPTISLSAIASGYGFRYLFGFGALSGGSTFWVSLAFTVLVASAAASAAISKPWTRKRIAGAAQKDS
ncbi:MAG: hypothetical protein ACYCO0_03415 [Candidatus Micrarchaeaceae archaeon]